MYYMCLVVLGEKGEKSIITALSTESVKGQSSSLHWTAKIQTPRSL